MRFFTSLRYVQNYTFGRSPIVILSGQKKLICINTLSTDYFTNLYSNMSSRVPRLRDRDLLPKMFCHSEPDLSGEESPTTTCRHQFEEITTVALRTRVPS